MNDEQIKTAVTRLNKNYSKDGAAAPHKPLLLLLLIGHYWNNGSRLVLFRDVAIPLWGLLRTCGFEEGYPIEKTLNPFATLNSAGDFWERSHPEIDRHGYRKAFLAGMVGGFTETLYRRVINDKVFLFELAALIHEKHLGDKNFKELLQGANIPNADPSKPGTLDGSSVKENLIPLDRGCTICGYRGSVYNKWPAGICQTHVKWPVAGGPEHDPDNILYMCDLHKSLFECGVFTFDQQRHRLIVSSSYNGQFANLEELADQTPPDRIKPEYLEWHKRIVFCPN